MSRDTEWFSRPGRLFIKNVSIDAPPLTPDAPVKPEDLISADGMCPGMEPAAVPADANASAGATGSTLPQPTGTVALGHTECDVARGLGAPDNVNLSTDSVGRRVAVLTYSKGSRAGIYTFKSGRLSSIEGAPQPEAPPRPVRHRKKRAAS